MNLVGNTMNLVKQHPYSSIAAVGGGGALGAAKVIRRTPWYLNQLWDLELERAILKRGNHNPPFNSFNYKAGCLNGIKTLSNIKIKAVPIIGAVALIALFNSASETK